jgi:N-acetylglucosaminyldiphosphoundecaprenol N-acetyl-beta-D-mannosaminyltransferase
VTDFKRDVHCLLGLPFDAIDLGGAVHKIRDAAGQRKRCFFSTPNLNFVIGCGADTAFRNSVINSDLSVADGMPLIWLARFLRLPIRERVAGSDVFEALRKSAGPGLSVYFFGGAPGVAAEACRNLQESPGLVCVGHHSPGFGSVSEMSGDETIANINSSAADFLLVSLGAKKGQAWIERNRGRLNTPVISHLGAVVNIVAGTVQRAPEWMQKVGLEWFWRIIQEPMLWRRYYADGVALITLLLRRTLPYAYWLRRAQIANRILPIGLHVTEQDERYVIRLRGALTIHNLEPVRHCFDVAANSGRYITLDMTDVSYVDSAFLGLAILLHGHQIQNGKRMLLISVPAHVSRIIRYACADYLLSAD